MSQPSPQAEQSAEFPGGWFLYMFKLIEAGLRPSLEEVLARHGFTTAQYTALSVLQIRPGITSSELARRSFVKAQSMAETVGHLAEQGLLRRERDPSHARRLLLFPTQKGLDALRGVERPVVDVETEVLSDLDDPTKAQLAAVLRSLRHNIHQLNSASP